MQASWVCSAPSASHSAHTDRTAHPRLRPLILESTLFPLGMEVVLPVPRMGEKLLRPSVLLLALDALSDHLPANMATNNPVRLRDWAGQLCHPHLTCLHLPVLPDNADHLQ